MRGGASRLLQRVTTRTLAASEPPRYTRAVGKVEKIEQQIQELSADELARLREWFAAFDAAAWDRQFEEDVNAGKLDALGERALKSHAAGKTTKL